MSDQPKHQTNMTEHDLLFVEAICKYPNYKKESNRLRSFEQGWPHSELTHPYCTPTALAAAGFFYHNYQAVYTDGCSCFYCG